MPRSAIPRTGIRRTAIPRTVAAALGVVVLCVPSVQAVAVDDPGPVQWPKIAQPDTGGNSADPGPIKWTTVAEPDANGSSDDPKPAAWPTVLAQ